MDQQSLFHECLTDAINDCIRALGGNKKVGGMLWPEKGVEDARRALLDALNPDRPNKLSPDQALLIVSEAAKQGCLAGITYITRACRCADPQPIEPEDERAALQRQFVEQSKAMQQLFARMERAGLRAA